jgi:zinc protease
MGGRLDDDFYAVELLSDVLSRGNSSRLYRSLVQDRQIFSEVHAYITSSLDRGMFILEGKPLENISIEQAEAALWEELEKVKNEEIPADELTKVQNKTESTMVFSEMSLLDKAMNLASFELLGDAEMLNEETFKYLAVTADQIRDAAVRIFRKDNSSTLVYLAEKTESALA